MSGNFESQRSDDLADALQQRDEKIEQLERELAEAKAGNVAFDNEIQSGINLLKDELAEAKAALDYADIAIGRLNGGKELQTLMRMNNEARNAALEEAAKVAEAYAFNPETDEIVKAIRALIQETKE